MKVLLYFENEKIMSISGIGRARKHQIMACESAGIDYTLDPLDDYDILHINTYMFNSNAIINKARREGKGVIYHAHSTEEDFRDSFIFSNQIAPVFKKHIVSLYSLADEIITPTEYSKKLLINYGIGNVILCDRTGAIVKGRENMNPVKEKIAEITNKNNEHGSLADVIKGKDIFLGVSAPNTLAKEMVSSMARDAIIFAMANPVPEIMPEDAKEAGAKVIATGRSDFPNQINNVLVFPGIFRGALDAHATKITEEMKMAAAKAIASLVSESELNPEYIIPDAFDERVAKVVSESVMKVAKEQGICKNI